MIKNSLITLLTVTLLACGSETSGPQRQIAERLLQETSETFSRNQVASWEESFSWTFEDSRQIADWNQEGFDRMSEAREGRWVLGASKPDAFIQRPTAFHSDSVDRIEVIMGGTGQRPLKLQWTVDDSTFDDRQALEVRGEGSASRYIFDLASHPHWQGEITSLRLVPRLRPRLRSRMVSVRGLHSAADPARRERSSQRPFKVTLGGSSRTARLVLPGAPLTQTVTPSHGDHLEVAFGLDLENPADVEFRIDAGIAGGPSRTLLQSEVMADLGPIHSAAETPVAPSTARRAGQWHTASLDLSSWAGQEVELRFHVRSADNQDRSYGFWGDVRITRPLDGDPPPNVILVVIDTLRADHLSLYGYPRQTTPNLDRWAKERAVTFRSVVAASSWTYPSHVSLFSGLDVLSHGQFHPRTMPRRFDLLAQHLQRAGYETLAITGGGFMDVHYGFARGFDRYYVAKGRMGTQGDLEEGLARAKEWTDNAHRPYFLFLHTYEVHTPHRVRQPFHRQLSGHDGDPEQLALLTTQALPTGEVAGAVRRKTYAWKDGEGTTRPFEEGDLQQVIDAYDSAIAFTDHHLSQFLDSVTSKDDSPLVIITSDHGEALGEYELADHAYLYDFNLKIPLIMALPDQRGAGTIVDEQVRQIDVAPTLLEALDLPVPPMDGASLLPFFTPGETSTIAQDPDANIAWSATAYQGVSLRRGNRLKYVFNPTIWQREKAKEALFSIDRDPQEAHDLAADHGATEELQQRAIRRIMEGFDGLLLGFENPSPEEILIAVEGPHWIGPQFFKSVDAPPQTFTFTDQTLQIVVPSKSRFSVVIDQVAPQDPILIDIETASGSCSMDLSTLQPELRDGVYLQKIDSSCREIDDVSADDLSLSLLYRHPEPRGPAGVGEELPAELANQLRALGYLD